VEAVVEWCAVLLGLEVRVVGFVGVAEEDVWARDRPCSVMTDRVAASAAMHLQLEPIILIQTYPCLDSKGLRALAVRSPTIGEPVEITGNGLGCI
jgi:hypothetical protein